MDLQDVSDVERHMQDLALRKDCLRAASRRKGQVPTDRLPRGEIINQQMESVLLSRIGQIASGPPKTDMYTSFLPPSYLPSIKPLKDLKQIFIKDMELETHHWGSYVLLRAVTPPRRIAGILTVVEDEKDEVVWIQIYQQEHEEVRPAREIISPKSIVVVKEPYFKVTSDCYALRVDHVSDLIWLTEDDDRIPECWRLRIMEVGKTTIDWKQEGDADLKAKNLHDAVQKYTLALQCSPTAKETDVIKTNRSLVNLKLRRYDEVLLDTISTPASEMSETCILRAVLAYYGLSRFQNCHDSLEVLLHKYHDHPMANQEFSRVWYRLREQSSGESDFKSMYEATNTMPLSFDNATYVGPIEVKDSEGRGKGLFTTRDVNVGELLLCEKAFSHCYADESGESAYRIGTFMDTNTSQVTVGTEGYLIMEIVQQLQRNPSQIPDFLSLYRGSYQSVGVAQVDGKPIIDTFLVAQIVALNVFGCPLTSLKDLYGTPASENQGSSKSHHSTGIWLHASLICHSCHSNIRRSFIGSMQLIRATRAIPAHTEITFEYHVPDPNAGIDERQQKLQHWGFECTCAICTDEKTTPKQTLRKRTGLLGDLKVAFSQGPDVAKAERLLSALEKTYKTPASAVPRLALYVPYLALLRHHVTRNKPYDVISFASKFFRSLGFILHETGAPEGSKHRPFNVEQWGLMCDSVIEAWLSYWAACAIVEPELVGMAEEGARMAYRICVGEDGSFEQTVGRRVREAIGRGGCF